MRLFISVYIIIALLATTMAYGDIYQWVDDRGVTSFTDDLDKVPQQYRSTLTRKEVPPVPAAGARQNGKVPVTPGKANAALADGQSDEVLWRTRFASLKEGIATLQTQIEDKKQALQKIHRRRVIYSKASDRVAYHELLAEITNDESRLLEMQKDLTNLNAEADSKSIPSEWR
jgi:hypothetical protein